MTKTTIFRLKFNRSYTTFVKTGRGFVTVTFLPVVLFGRTENSQFSTADAEVVEALRRHEHYGSLFYIERDGTEPAKRQKGRNSTAGPDATGKQTPKTETEDAEPTASQEPEPSQERAQPDPVQSQEAPVSGQGGEEDGYTHEKSVTSRNKAIAYLLERHGAQFTQTADIAAMKEEARTVYRVIFDNWD